jgi:hypothetical protein
VRSMLTGMSTPANRPADRLRSALDADVKRVSDLIRGISLVAFGRERLVDHDSVSVLFLRTLCKFEVGAH